MKNIIFAAPLFFILFGCSATPDKVRTSPPRIFESPSSSELVVSCLYEKYDGIGMLALLSTVPKGDGGKTVKVSIGSTIKLLVDISPNAVGSTIRSYENLAVLPQDRAIIAECGTAKLGSK